MDSSVKEMAITNINGKIQEIAKSAIIILEKKLAVLLKERTWTLSTFFFIFSSLE